MFSSANLKQFIGNKTLSRVIIRNFVFGRNLNKTRSQYNLKRYVKGTFFGVTVGAIAYDGFNEFQVYGGILRFLRTLKIAALISIDYSWHLYGLTDNSDKYEQVRKNRFY